MLACINITAATLYNYNCNFPNNMGNKCLKYLLCLQLVDVKTKELLAEALLSHHNTIQYCDFCPNSHIVAVALSHCSVEVSKYIISILEFLVAIMY